MTAADELGPPRDEPTPRRVFLPKVARARVDAVARARDALRRDGLTPIAAFSFKTNPGAMLIGMARERGFRAEVISPDELRWARELRFGAGEIVYNGPHPPPAGEPIGVIFADSIEAFAANARASRARLPGVRLRPAMLPSRFGVPVEDDAALAGAVAASDDDALGVSFHARRGDFHGASWREVAGDVLDRAVALQARTHRAIRAFDVGGGWTPEEFDATFAPDMTWLAERIRAELPACEELIFEPGQSLCTPTEALLTRVVEVRARDGRREAIVDAGYPEWPQMHSYVHGFFAWRDGAWRALGRGGDRLGGRTCLEYDVIDGLRFPDGVAPGDVLLIDGTGSYDRSMAFDFARGAT